MKIIQWSIKCVGALEYSFSLGVCVCVRLCECKTPGSMSVSISVNMGLYCWCAMCSIFLLACLWCGCPSPYRCCRKYWGYKWKSNVMVKSKPFGFEWIPCVYECMYYMVLFWSFFSCIDFYRTFCFRHVLVHIWKHIYVKLLTPLSHNAITFEWQKEEYE